MDKEKDKMVRTIIKKRMSNWKVLKWKVDGKDKEKWQCIRKGNRCKRNRKRRTITTVCAVIINRDAEMKWRQMFRTRILGLSKDGKLNNFHT